MKLRLMTILLFFLLCSAITAQNTGNTKTHHYFGYQLGGIQLKEKNLIPKVHRGVIHILTYGFEKRQENYKIFQFVFGYSNPKTTIEREAERAEDYDKINGQIYLKYSYNFKVFNRKNINLYIGPKFSYTYSLSYYEGWDSHAYWGNYLSTGPSSVLTVDLKDNKSWLFSLDLSLLGFYNRPDCIRLYKEEDWSFKNVLKTTNENYNLGLFSNAFQLNFKTEYRFPVSKGKYFTFVYTVYFSRIKSKNSKSLLELFYSIGGKIIL